jgi:polar amino acid transport system substrate-binding protein
MRRSWVWIVLCIGALPAHAATVSIRADEWFPINGEPGSAQPGIMIELAQTILGAAGHTIDYRLMGWDDAIARTGKGEFDCVVGALADEAEGFVYPQQAWVQSAQSLYVRNDFAGSYSGPADLAKLKLAVIDSYSYGDTLDAYIAANRADPAKILLIRNETKPLRAAMTRVLVGQADALLETSVVMDATLKASGFAGKLKSLSAAEPGQIESLYIACSPNKTSSKTYAALFDEGFRAMAADGRLKALFARYGVSPPTTAGKAP